MLVFIAVAMVTLLGFLAMTLDVGAGHRMRRMAQTAADAGAWGGGTEIYRRMGSDTVIASARNEAIRNGFPADDVTVNYPPATGAFAGNNQYVEVIINRTIPTIFGSIFNISSLNTAARAVAGVGSHSLTCLYSLDPSGAGAINVQNGGELDTNCGVSINSTSPSALDVNNSGTLDASGNPIGIAGGWSGNKTPSPAPGTGASPVMDPFNYLTPPTVGACTQTGLLTLTKDTTLTPGVYCGGIRVKSKTATFSAPGGVPGMYILKGGLVVETSGIVTGSEITFYNTFDGTYPYGKFDFGTGCKATLSAPTSGPYKNILMYQDPAAPADVQNVFACSSDTPPELTGSLYFPTQEFLFNGSNSGTTIQGTVVAKKVTVKAKVTIINETSSNTAIHRLSLVE
jgi:hypothetical protein